MTPPFLPEQGQFTPLGLVDCASIVPKLSGTPAFYNG